MPTNIHRTRDGTQETETDGSTQLRFGNLIIPDYVILHVNIHKQIQFALATHAQFIADWRLYKGFCHALKAR